jgi:hypothetical protein
MNNQGTIVFEADFSGGLGIFTQAGLLVQTGDAIDGKRLTYVEGPRDQRSRNNRLSGFL